MEKAELIRNRAKMELEASQTRQAALDLEEKMERLRRAKGSLHHVIADAWQQERKIGHIDAQPSFWKGETKNKYSEMMQSMASSTHRYVNGWMRAEAKFGDPPKNLSERTKGLVNRGVDKAKKMDQNLSRRKKRHRPIF
ncbi:MULTISPECIES: YwqH-like family protein [Heyndrickxia]|uniref:YwqH-like family protein n=1 Tax=Heyndrickxia TaxID=2837504 RepID=UPI002DB67960|nr:DUF5082 family protein [Weizmannia sp. CD-2023]MEC2223628.1 DUF5082 family protein [Weizmannia sp. CD-2023]